MAFRLSGVATDTPPQTFCAGKSEIVKDSAVVQTMRYMELLKELKKSGNKKQKVI